MRIKDNERVQRAEIKMANFVLIGWLSRFSRVVTRSHPEISDWMSQQSLLLKMETGNWFEILNCCCR